MYSCTLGIRVVAVLAAVLLAMACGDNLSPPGLGGDAGVIDARPTEPDAAPYQECGDGLVTGTEECDDDNASDEDECLSTCMLACGDGVVNAIEKCDISIAAGSEGACPMACEDNDVCTTNVLSGDNCQSECLYTEITAFVDDDGCCPEGGDSIRDSDCPVVCGNGVVEMGELCDIGSVAGQAGACPVMADCVDNAACTTDLLVNPGTCMAMCANPEILVPVSGDGCCPSGATPATDSDCLPDCGNGVVNAGETCDIAIAPGNPGACPTSCDDNTACTTDMLVGGTTCTATCRNTPITTPGAADMCCPATGNANNDPDCVPSCGNSVVETGEQCDDGNRTAGDGCSGSCQLEPTAFRITSMQFRDPHAFVRIVFACSDQTGTLNTQLNNALTMDDDGDGLLDLSVVTLFRPLNQSGASTPMEVWLPDCRTTAQGTTCAPSTLTPTMSTATNQSTTGAICLQPLAGTVRPSYSPSITNATAPCFASGAQTLMLDIGGIMLTLTDARVAATYNANPATGLINGLLMGFVSEADANNIILPDDLPVVGGQPLSSLLPGGAGNCSTTSDKDIGPNGVPGWWFYLNFTAQRVTWTGP